MLAVSTLAAFICFGSIIIAYASYTLYRAIVLRTPAEDLILENGAKPSETLRPNVASVEKLARAGAEVGLVALITWMCENKPVFEHASKIHDVDLFLFVISVAFLVAVIFSVHVSSKDQGILNRDQTEEWRGFMQMIFLLYHYFALEEVYPLIRLFISCYVFLTGFGNTSFFYLKRDYSVVRLLSMLWRLCFSCLVLAITNDNPIILYYIVPLHTFYFLMAYVTMALFERQVNYTKYGLKAKLAILGILIYVIWEFPAIFEIVFSPLSDEPHPGAAVGAYGTRYEWQFRSGLDHYSAFFGMVFASGFPLVELRENSVLSHTPILRGVLAIISIAGIVIWSVALFPLPKLAFNARHAYSFIMPMCGYLFLRNLTPYLRRVHLGMFAFAGKYTLETYLLQHHVWLTSNAKTVLVILPGFPKTNFLIVSVGYFLLSMKLFNLTVSTKNMLIPLEDGGGGIMNIVVVGGFVGFCFLSAQIIALMGGGLLLATLAAGSLSVALFLGARMYVTVVDKPSSARARVPILLFSTVFLIVGLVCSAFPAEVQSYKPHCNPNDGYWVPQMSFQCGEAPQSSFAYCSARAWTWPTVAQRECGWKHISKIDEFESIILVGKDEQYALALARLVEPSFQYSSKNPATSFAKGQIIRLDATDDIPDAKLKPNSIVWCLEKEAYPLCETLTKGIPLALVENDSFTFGEKVLIVDAGRIKATALKADKIDKDVYRDDVYDVIAQIGLNAASRVARKPAKITAPPPGGLAHDPILGAVFLGAAFIALFLGDGYLGLVAIFGRLFRVDAQVTWDRAVEKIHASVPGLNEVPQVPALETNGTVAPEAEKDVEGLTEEDTAKLIPKS